MLPQSAKADSSLGDGAFKRKEADASKEPMTEADRAYDHAVEVCDRIIRELDEELERRNPYGTRKADPRSDR